MTITAYTNYGFITMEGMGYGIAIILFTIMIFMVLRTVLKTMVK